MKMLAYLNMDEKFSSTETLTTLNLPNFLSNRPLFIYQDVVKIRKELKLVDNLIVLYRVAQKECNDFDP